MKSIKLLALSVVLAVVGTASAETYSKFVKGVTETSGYYDVNKTFDGTDDDLCWAAAVSNVIKWWQNSQPSIPDGTPRGDATTRYSSDIFQTFVNSFENDGGDEMDGFVWWLTGEYDPAEYRMKDGASPAGFWKSMYPDADIFFYQFDLQPVYAAGGNALELFTSELVRNVDMGHAMTFGIYADEGGAHAVTLWGYELDDSTGNIVSIYMSDSDDVPQDDGGQPHLEQQPLSKVALDYRDDKIYLTDSYDGWYIGDVTFYSVGAMIPEPSTATLGIGTLLVFMICRRRRQD